ncbi:methylation site containing protein [Catenovulum agarivorans DS-2]|uniref:Type II secretion system protein H n=1 Tax=Catenovulum agarivorans DS-2 TaxID=1328313 RepID=W7Q867_9ALTE|nr:GspH/FimT family pseudopilin [Catenovulum agarivorans]EWH09014.1 methylation site containing protein [Catenovulum agarivorans DS-2]
MSLFTLHQSFQRGFTLLELMITLAIAGVALTIGVPSLLEAIVENRVNTVVMNLNKDIVSARSYAVNYETTITICHLNTNNECDTNWHLGYTVFIDRDGNESFSSNTEKKLFIRDKITSGDSLVFSDGSSLQFQFDGTPITTFTNNAQATFKYCPSVSDAELYSKALIIGLSGRPRTSSDIDGDGKDEINDASDHIVCS